jgi:ribosome biogenesis SPOUT family RNA methylase Rps3
MSIDCVQILEQLIIVLRYSARTISVSDPPNLDLRPEIWMLSNHMFHLRQAFVRVPGRPLLALRLLLLSVHCL